MDPLSLQHFSGDALRLSLAECLHHWRPTEDNTHQPRWYVWGKAERAVTLDLPRLYWILRAVGQAQVL